LGFRFSSVLAKNRGFGFGLKTVNSPTTDCSDDSRRDTFFGKHERGARDFWCAAP